MLHILLVILKIIGIILAVILGILVLLICIVLFVPVRYLVDAECEHFPDKIRGSVKVTWFLHLIRASVRYDNKETKVKIKVAWKEIGEKEDEKENEKDEESPEKKPVEKKPVEKVEKMEKELLPKPESAEKKAEKESVQPEGIEEKRQENHENNEEESAGDPEPDGSLEGSAKKRNSFFEKIKKIFQKTGRLGKKLIQSIEKLKCTFKAFCDKIKALSEKKDRLSEFIKNKTHQKALSKVKKEGFKLLRRLKPKKLIADVQYGFEDPCMTGQVLAGLGMLYPFLGTHVQITPDFEQKVLEGHLEARGRIYVMHFAALLWTLIWSRDVRTTYKDIRNFKL